MNTIDESSIRKELREILATHQNQLPEDITEDQLFEYVEYHIKKNNNPQEVLVFPTLYSHVFEKDIQDKLDNIISNSQQEIPETINNDTQQQERIYEDQYGRPAPQKEKKKNKLLKPILIGVGVLVLAIIAFFGIGFFTNPFEAQEDSANIYIYQGEDAKTSVEFKNKKGSEETLNLNCGDEFGTKSFDIKGNSTQKVDLDFGKVKEDKTITAKYGFMNMKKVEIKVIAIPKSQITINSNGVKIKAENKDITSKKYYAPNKEITFTATIYNGSGKDFERNFDFKINDKVIETKKAVWYDDGPKSTELTFKYNFTKQGFYKVKIGDTNINYICSTNDKAPSNGTILKQKVSGGMGVLELTNNYSYDIIVTLAYQSSPQKAQNRIYIKAKKKATMNGIKDGTYIIYIKGGTGYSKMAKDILETKSSYKSDSKIKFRTTSSTYTIWKIRLGVYGGNMNISPVDDNSLPI